MHAAKHSSGKQTRQTILCRTLELLLNNHAFWKIYGVDNSVYVCSFTLF